MNAKRINRIATGVIYFLVGIVVLLLVGIIGNILVSGVPQLSWHFLSSASSSFEAGGGIRDQLFNSLYLLLLTLIISLPIALGAAIYLAEYAPDNWFTQLIRTTIEILSSLPSIVVGLFGYLLFVVQFGLGFSILAGALALTFFNLPTLTSNIEEAIKGVPQTQREAGWALGLSNWKTIHGIVLPAALPGIITGVILSAGRVFGEAAALIYTAGQSGSTVDYSNWNMFSPTSFLNIMRPAETLAVHIWKVNTEGIIPDVNVVSAATSALLIIVVIIFNFGARALGNWIYKRLTAAKIK
ncbi:phosphate ABC transporter permease PstA [Lactobacillus helsingborgensis]|uniref:phosphate ABC transporter permease PstA n=1 Tax=Lactobacillus helsingborgensis TaxID=1218494 RepID=UPI0016509B9E|nr:phosphate ABC transporter permease PstA [Lactobacillus helsingborgensis]MBC6357087.1 phosphate ABC transporter permease PstA [Lactobacillus helsingborgensis]